ncbi:Sialyltransferase-like protein 5, partial [Mucuna pruriens]
MRLHKQVPSVNQQPIILYLTILLWEQYRNMTTMLTREYLDARSDGWVDVDYASLRIAQLGTKSSSVKKVGVGSLMNEASALPLSASNIYMEEVQVKLGEELHIISYHVCQAWYIVPQYHNPIRTLQK